MSFPNIPTDNPRPKPTPRPPKPSIGTTSEDIWKTIRDEFHRLNEAEDILADIHDQLEKTGEVSPFTAARLRIFMEGK